MSIRIHALAKELNIQSKELIDFINRRQDVYHLEIKTPSNAIDPFTAEAIGKDYAAAQAAGANAPAQESAVPADAPESAAPEAQPAQASAESEAPKAEEKPEAAEKTVANEKQPEPAAAPKQEQASKSEQAPAAGKSPAPLVPPSVSKPAPVVPPMPKASPAPAVPPLPTQSRPAPLVPPTVGRAPAPAIPPTGAAQQPAQAQGKKEFKQLSAFTTENYMTLKSDNNYDGKHDYHFSKYRIHISAYHRIALAHYQRSKYSSEQCIHTAKNNCHKTIHHIIRTHKRRY